MKTELILCQSSDDNLQNIKNVFSEISIDEDNKISFTVICKVLYEESDLIENAIHIFIIKHIDEETIKGLYLSEIQLTKENNDEDSFKDEYLNIPVLGKGKYSIVVVLNNEMKDTDMSSGSTVYDTGKIIGEVRFDII